MQYVYHLYVRLCIIHSCLQSAASLPDVHSQTQYLSEKSRVSGFGFGSRYAYPALQKLLTVRWSASPVDMKIGRICNIIDWVVFGIEFGLGQARRAVVDLT